jgi:hypothetical protein
MPFALGREGRAQENYIDSTRPNEKTWLVIYDPGWRRN